ncbi:MAG: DUF362 domain-containing protein [Desulfobacterales bacterium]|nr:DUF362 domain-containing protein [Desulfobacterales bacterium]MBF0395835.1 DUF362 domain-containing protein [Desulfobacterales bacterium]
MKSSVYFMDLTASPKENLLQKLGRLCETAGISKFIQKKDLVALKLHFGELGNTAFIRPVFIRKIVQMIKEKNASPFLTDANTVYAGTRSDAPSHLTTAICNGFDYSVVDAPIVIADGLRGRSETPIIINQKRFKEVYIGSEIVEADALISIAHFKGHELSGFGGAIKNIGMGCASRRGKFAQHSNVSPKVVKKKCIGCGDCISHCSQEAISLLDGKAGIDVKKCIGCGECILICQNNSIQIEWNQSVPIFLEMMVEYTMGVLSSKKNKAFFINFITNISPACDCYGYNDAPIVRDIGIVASADPIAIDQASVDLVNNETALPGSCLKTSIGAGEDKFRGVYPNVDWKIQLEYAESLGIGSRSYELIKI